MLRVLSYVEDELTPADILGVWLPQFVAAGTTVAVKPGYQLSARGLQLPYLATGPGWQVNRGAAAFPHLDTGDIRCVQRRPDRLLAAELPQEDLRYRVYQWHNAIAVPAERGTRWIL